MKPVQFPAGFRLERLVKAHPRSKFSSGQQQVNDWLRTKAFQHQAKRLSTTRVLVDVKGSIAGYYTLAMGQVDFGELPQELAKHLPRRMLPVAVLAWLGVGSEYQGQGLGRLLLAQALRDCYEASRAFAFVAVILDCVDDAAKAFYQRFDFAELPGHPYRLCLTAAQLDALMHGA
jgi:ribosomal protein S18 acetylase RimI-like enzyme